MPTTPLTLVWFRDDLRVTDNAALAWALSRGEVTGLLIDDTSGPRPLGRAAAWWRDRSAAELSTKVPLIRKTGDPREIVPRLARELGAEVAWNRRYDATELDAEVKSATGARTFPGFLLAEPWEISSGAGTPYRVFTPFYKALQQHLTAHQPQPAAGRLRSRIPPRGRTGWHSTTYREKTPRSPAFTRSWRDWLTVTATTTTTWPPPRPRG